MGFFSSISKSISKAVSDTTKTVSKAVNDTSKEISNSWNKNKDGVNATAGLAARGALAYGTGGLSETFGAGNLVTTQFGGAKDTSSLGALAGLAGGAYDGFAKDGFIQGMKNLGKTSLSNLFNNGAQMPQNYVMQSSEGNMDFLDGLGDIGLDYARQKLMGSAKDKKVSQPSLPPAQISVPVPTEDPKQKNMMVAGGALVLLLVVMLASRKA